MKWNLPKKWWQIQQAYQMYKFIHLLLQIFSVSVNDTSNNHTHLQAWQRCWMPVFRQKASTLEVTTIIKDSDNFLFKMSCYLRNPMAHIIKITKHTLTSYNPVIYSNNMDNDVLPGTQKLSNPATANKTKLTSTCWMVLAWYWGWNHFSCTELQICLRCSSIKISKAKELVHSKMWCTLTTFQTEPPQLGQGCTCQCYCCHVKKCSYEVPFLLLGNMPTLAGKIRRVIHNL